MRQDKNSYRKHVCPPIKVSFYNITGECAFVCVCQAYISGTLSMDCPSFVVPHIRGFKANSSPFLPVTVHALEKTVRRNRCFLRPSIHVEPCSLSPKAAPQRNQQQQTYVIALESAFTGTWTQDLHAKGYTTRLHRG